MPVSSATQAQAFTLARGEALRIDFSPDSSVPAAEKDITGQALAFVVRPARADLDDIATYSQTILNGGIVLVSAVNGTFYATLSKAQTVILPVDLYDWELWRTDSGSEKRLAFGKIQVVRSVQYPT